MSAPKPPTITELLEEFSTAMLITHGPNGLRMRPMAVVDIEQTGRVWFIASTDSAKVHEIEADTHVHLAFQKDHDCYLTVNGTAELLQDRERIAELWKDDFNPWFPGGMEDPEIVLIAVTPKTAEYWQHRAPKIFGSWKADEAYIHGTKPEMEVVSR